MKVFRIDRTKLSDYLQRKGLNHTNLAERLNLSYRPTRRTIDAIKTGNVPRRWRKAVADLVGIAPPVLYINNRIDPQYLNRVAHHPGLPKIAVYHNLTRMAISRWFDPDEGGIEPEHLDALARFLGTDPIELVVPETASWMQSFLEGGIASPPDH